jgi:two-component system, NtrC family, response regulator PilR
MRALIVDDDPSMRRVFWRCLSMWGWQAEECPSVADALAAFPKEPFDLALCDVDLPDGDGIALAQALLKTKPSLLVVVVSGSLDNLDRARRAGLRARLQKPFELAALKSLLEHESPAAR